MKEGKKISQNKLLMIVGILFFITVVCGAVYMLTFLSRIVASAFLTDTDSVNNTIKFNLEGFDKLNLTASDTGSNSVDTNESTSTGTSTE
jgi:anionic cell wall polymer biosynthesis LytR-Cps2A-Psr (LCP) family protein